MKTTDRAVTRARKALAHTIAHRAEVETERAMQRQRRAERGARQRVREALYLAEVEGDAFA